MTSAFAAVMEDAQLRADGFSATVPESWHQGRTAYGGFSAALAFEAARRVGGAGLPPLRSAAISFVGPTSSMVNVSGQILRKGRNATWIGAQVMVGEAVGTVATFAFMGPVASALYLNDRPPPDDFIAVEQAEPFAFHDHTPLFQRNYFEIRFARPRGATKEPELCWWVRLRERRRLDPMTEIMLVADSLPPGVLPLMDRRVPISSMNWQADLLTPAPRTRDGWWLLRSRGDYAENGCSSQQMAIWNVDGEPVMSGMQSIAMFG